MDAKEELFAQLFNHEKVLVRDMDTLTLRAHREELAKIAFEARARLTAADDELKSKEKSEKPKGFTRSVQTDDVTSDAIGKIKERNTKLNKHEKMIESLIKLGYSRADAEQKMSAGVELALKNKTSTSNGEVKPTDENAKSAQASFNPETQAKLDAEHIEAFKPKEVKPLVNPFAKK